MNALEQFIADRGWDEVKVMDYLQDEGRVISDNCIMARDVGNPEEAIRFLETTKYGQ